MPLTKRQRQALEILAQAERPLRNKDFHERFETDGRRTTGWAEALGPCTKPQDHDQDSLWAQGFVTVTDNRYYVITDLGRDLARSLGFEVIPPHSPVSRNKHHAPRKTPFDPETTATHVVLTDAEPKSDDAPSNYLADDVRTILNNGRISATEKESLVNARLGQGEFRTHLLKRWDQSCAVTGSTTLKVIRASHIKPWRKSTDEERLDPNNGLPLIANLDALFDAGLISFDANGTLITSPQLDSTEQRLFGVAGQSLRKMPSMSTARYLEYHLREVFRR